MKRRRSKVAYCVVFVLDFSNLPTRHTFNFSFNIIAAINIHSFTSISFFALLRFSLTDTKCWIWRLLLHMLKLNASYTQEIIKKKISWCSFKCFVSLLLIDSSANKQEATSEKLPGGTMIQSGFYHLLIPSLFVRLSVLTSGKAHEIHDTMSALIY